MRIALVTLFVCTFCVGVASATDFYVSPTGSASGDGSISRPWTFTAALAAPAAVHPGDTIWMRGGTYAMKTPAEFWNKLNGTATAPIIFRRYPGESVKIDLRNMASSLYVYGSNTWFWGLEITSTGIPRSTSLTGPWSILNSSIEVHGPGTKFINCYVHDLSQGLSYWNDSSGAEAYGNIVLHVGWQGGDRGHGHAIYSQNLATGATRKLLSDNFLGEAFDIGLQLYGSGAAYVQDYLLSGNVIWDNGIPTGTNVDQLVISGGGASKKNIEVDTNFVYNSGTSGYSRIGWQWDGENKDVNIHGNWFVGGFSPLEVWHWDSVQFHNNFICSSPGNSQALVATLQSANQTPARYGWDQNQYCAGNNKYLQTNLDSAGNDIILGGSDGSVASFQSMTGFDKASTYGTRPTQGAATFVRPNKYEAGRANIIIFNWQSMPFVPVNISTAGLKDGDQFVLMDVQNFGGPAVASGTYSSANPVIQVPMTNLAKVQIAGWGSTMHHTAPAFGTFILLGGGALNGVGGPTDTTAPVAAILNPGSGQVVTGTITVQATATDNVGVAAVQFKLDGVALGAAVTSAPYQISWNTAGAANGSHTLTAVAYDGAGNMGTSAGVPVTVSNAAPPPGSGPVAAFVRQDNVTAGNWKSSYGSDGAVIAGDLNSPPSYAQATPQGASYYLWNGNTTDPRALTSLTGSRIASSWYNATSFTIDLNITGSQARQVAIYLLDWDFNSRAERIDVVDATTGATLDSRSASSFTAGAYLVWNILGHVQFRVTKTSAGSNGVVSGIFFGGSSASGGGVPPSVTITSPTPNQSVSGVTTVTATASGSVSISQVQFKLDGGNLGSPVTAAPYQMAWNTTGATNGAHTMTAVATDSSGNTMTAVAVPVTVNNVAAPPPPSGNAVATFVRRDDTSQGNWHGVYGQDGTLIPGDLNATPSYAILSLNAASTWTWAATTADVRALRKQSGGRIASTWYNATSFTLDLNLSDGAAHTVALYLLDWDNNFRAERIDVLDAASGKVLDSRSAANFTNGAYLVWTLQGHVRLQVTKTSVGANGVVAGILFGGASAGSTDTTPPTVAISSPTANQTLSGTASLLAIASDNVGVAGVQFKVDGATLGAEQTAAPYTILWNTAAASNGAHTVSAVARDAAGNTATGTVQVTVANAAPPPAGAPAPVAYWALDAADLNSGTVLDHSGNNITLAAVNAVSTPGRVREAVAFNGASTVLSSASSSRLELNSSMTLSVWVQTLNSSRAEAVLSLYTSAGTESGYLLKTTSGGTVALRIGGKNLTSGSREFADSTRINDGVWHHVAVVITLGQSVTFYVDGIATSSAACVSQAGSSGAAFELGAVSFPYYGAAYTGSLDEVKIFDSALTAAQVASLAAGN